MIIHPLKMSLYLYLSPTFLLYHEKKLTLRKIKTTKYSLLLGKTILFFFKNTIFVNIFPKKIPW